MKVLFEDSNFVIVDKESGVLSVPAREGDKDPRPVLGKILEDKLKVQIYPIHRLDFEVSGIVFFAKNSLAHREANQIFEKRSVQKIYQCLSAFSDSFRIGEKLEWKSKIHRGKKRSFEAAHGKDALTIAKPIEKLDWNGIPCLLWELEPRTGRSHQLRFEMAKHALPIFGDQLYGSKTLFQNAVIALRATRVTLDSAEDSLLAKIPKTIIAPDLLSYLKNQELAK